MKTLDSYFITAEEGKRLIQNGKDIGVAVWFSPGKNIEGIENIGETQIRHVLRPEEGMVLKNKNGEYSMSVWSETPEDWEEVPESEYKEYIENERKSRHLPK